jgi:DNA-directed RNA polymerase specialized sigma24 family protein
MQLEVYNRLHVIDRPYLFASLPRLCDMGTIDKPKLDGQADSAKAAWHRFVETFEPPRPELYRYCRALTRNAWDAEDLVQDAPARGLVTIGCLFQEIENPRAWMFRVASNLWIDRQRRKRGVVSSAVLDAFCDAFNARDIERLVD